MNMAGKFSCIAMGIVSVVAGFFGLARWWPLFVEFLKAAFPPILVLGGAIAVVAGVTAVRDEATLPGKAAPRKDTALPKDAV